MEGAIGDEPKKRHGKRRITANERYRPRKGKSEGAENKHTSKTYEDMLKSTLKAKNKTNVASSSCYGVKGMQNSRRGGAA